jgi:hypothetical protein
MRETFLHARKMHTKNQKLAKYFAQQKRVGAHTAICGVVRIGRLQSIPSSNIESCACVSETVPLVACGQMNRPRSSRFANRHKTSS